MNECCTDSKKPIVEIITVPSILHEWDTRQLLIEWQSYFDTDQLHLILDLSTLFVINSVGINFLLQVLSKVEKAGGQLFLVNMSSGVWRVLEITKLTDVFDIRDSVEEVISEL